MSQPDNNADNVRETRPGVASDEGGQENADTQGAETDPSEDSGAMSALGEDPFADLGFDDDDEFDLPGAPQKKGPKTRPRDASPTKPKTVTPRLAPAPPPRSTGVARYQFKAPPPPKHRRAGEDSGLRLGPLSPRHGGDDETNDPDDVGPKATEEMEDLEKVFASGDPLAFGKELDPPEVPNAEFAEDFDPWADMKDEDGEFIAGDDDFGSPSGSSRLPGGARLAPAPAPPDEEEDAVIDLADSSAMDLVSLNSSNAIDIGDPLEELEENPASYFDEPELLPEGSDAGKRETVEVQLAPGALGDPDDSARGLVPPPDKQTRPRTAADSSGNYLSEIGLEGSDLDAPSSNAAGDIVDSMDLVDNQGWDEESELDALEQVFDGQGMSDLDFEALGLEQDEAETIMSDSATPALETPILDVELEPVSIDHQDSGEQVVMARPAKSETELLARDPMPEEPEPEPEPVDEEADALAEFVAQARAQFDEGNYISSLKICEEILEHAPDNPGAQQLADDNFDALGPNYLTLVNNIESRVTLEVDLSEITKLNLDSRGGFLITRIDGTLSFADLIELSSMPTDEVVLLLTRFLDHGVISVAD